MVVQDCSRASCSLPVRCLCWLRRQAHRDRAQAKARLVGAGVRRRSSRIATCCGCCARRRCIAENASWLFRVDALFGLRRPLARRRAGADLRHRGWRCTPIADLIALVALLASARFMLALAGIDVGTSFGGHRLIARHDDRDASPSRPCCWSSSPSRSCCGTTALTEIADFMRAGTVGLRVSLGLALVAFTMVALAENARIPVDNPATHLELTMVHEAMVLEYSGRHLALIEAARHAEAAALHVADRLHLRPLGLGGPRRGPGDHPGRAWRLAR